MDRIVLTISSELFDDNPRHEASIRTNTTVRGLIDEIRREFNLLDGNYSLTLKGSKKPLESDKTLDQLGVQTGSELIFERERRRLSQRVRSRFSSGLLPVGAVAVAIAELGRIDAAEILCQDLRDSVGQRANPIGPKAQRSAAADPRELINHHLQAIDG